MMVPASLLNSYTFCPRAIYLSRVLKLDPESSIQRSRGLVAHALRREVSIRQARMLSVVQDEDDLLEGLSSELEKVLSDLPHIYPWAFKGLAADDVLSSLRDEALSEILLLGGSLKALSERIGFDAALQKVTPWKVEYSVSSRGLGISGRIDKVMFDSGYVPVEIKTGIVPSGVWEGDRLQTCAYAMLLEDRVCPESPIGKGFVEYTRAQELRSVLTSEALRREVVSTRDSIIDLLEAASPPPLLEGSPRKCESCGFKVRCRFI